MTKQTHHFLYRNSLSIFLIVVFLAILIGQAVTGWHVHNEELTEHGQPALSFIAYLSDPHFREATSENWESEFLQMGFYVVLTVFLRQQGSAESKSLDQEEEVDRDPELDRRKKNVPWPVRHGGWILRLYEHSLSGALLVLFLCSFLWHLHSGHELENEERELLHLPPQSLGEFFSSSTFWFQSLQNWQSEFLAVFTLVFLSIWLREKGSPESKPVSSPHDETGG